jgi:hypothetical protein
MLIGNRKVWDADILCRTILEGTIKLLYMTEGTEKEQSDKFNEFWNLQPHFEKFKKSKKAENLLNVIGKMDDEKFKFIKDMIVTEEQMNQFETNYPEKYVKTALKLLQVILVSLIILARIVLTVGRKISVVMTALENRQPTVSCVLSAMPDAMIL